MSDRRKNAPRPPDEDLATVLSAATKAGLVELLGAVVPGAGAIAALLGKGFPGLATRRAAAWQSDIQRTIAELQRRSINIESLQGNDEFCDLVLDATQAAMRTHQEEKLVALRHALVNSCLDSDLSRARGRAFVRLIDELDVLHLCLLDFLSSPNTWCRTRGRSLIAPASGMQDRLSSPAALHLMIDREFREGIDEVLRDLALDDLVRRGLAKFDRYDACLTHSSFSTVLGEQFLAFISEPSENV